jgi:glutamate dehydrogenase
VSDRDKLLAEMTDEVSALVLRDNYEQAAALGNARAQVRGLLPVHRRLIADLEQRGRLDRALEAMPSDEDLAARSEVGGGLTSPEFAVLMAYVKIDLEDEIVASTLPDDGWTASVLAEYFPTPLRERYADRMAGHALRRDIITTVLVNEVINRCGITFVYRAGEESGATAADVIRAYVIVRDVFGLAELWTAVEALDSDHSVPTAAQVAVYLEARRLVDRAVRWLLSSRRVPLSVPTEIARLRPGVERLLPQVESLFRGNERDALRAHAAELVSLGIPPGLASWGTRVMYSFGLLDVVTVVESTGRDTEEVAGVYFVLSERFRVDALLSKISDLPREDRWQTLARMALRYDLYAALAALTGEVLNTPANAAGDEPAGATTAEDLVARWEKANPTAIARARNSMGDFDDSRADLAVLSVMLRQIRTLVQTAAA